MALPMSLQVVDPASGGWSGEASVFPPSASAPLYSPFPLYGAAPPPGVRPETYYHYIAPQPRDGSQLVPAALGTAPLPISRTFPPPPSSSRQQPQRGIPHATAPVGEVSKKSLGGPPHTWLSARGAPSGTFPVIDPRSRRLFIPLHAMLETRAMHRHGVPSLCCIALEGRCRQGANCFQAHAEPNVVKRLRAVALARPTCCPFHGAASMMHWQQPRLPSNLVIAVVKEQKGASHLNSSHSHSHQHSHNKDVVSTSSVEVYSTAQRITTVPLCRVSATIGLRALLDAQYPPTHENTTAESYNFPPELCVPSSALCRLHLQHNGIACCRFEGDCKFVHICREVVPPRESDCFATSVGSRSPPSLSRGSPSAVNSPTTAATPLHCPVGQTPNATAHLPLGGSAPPPPASPLTLGAPLTFLNTRPPNPSSGRSPPPACAYSRPVIPALFRRTDVLQRQNCALTADTAAEKGGLSPDTSGQRGVADSWTFSSRPVLPRPNSGREETRHHALSPPVPSASAPLVFRAPTSRSTHPHHHLRDPPTSAPQPQPGPPSGQPPPGLREARDSSGGSPSRSTHRFPPQQWHRIPSDPAVCRHPPDPRHSIPTPVVNYQTMNYDNPLLHCSSRSSSRQRSTTRGSTSATRSSRTSRRSHSQSHSLWSSSQVGEEGGERRYPIAMEEPHHGSFESQGSLLSGSSSFGCRRRRGRQPNTSVESSVGYALCRLSSDSHHPQSSNNIRFDPTLLPESTLTTTSSTADPHQWHMSLHSTTTLSTCSSGTQWRNNPYRVEGSVVMATSPLDHSPSRRRKGGSGVAPAPHTLHRPISPPLSSETGCGFPKQRIASAPPSVRDSHHFHYAPHHLEPNNPLQRLTPPSGSASRRQSHSHRCSHL